MKVCHVLEVNIKYERTINNQPLTYSITLKNTNKDQNIFQSQFKSAVVDVFGKEDPIKLVYQARAR